MRERDRRIRRSRDVNGALDLHTCWCSEFQMRGISISGLRMILSYEYFRGTERGRAHEKRVISLSNVNLCGYFVYKFTNIDLCAPRCCI